jgi:hypothetical protein
MIEETQQHLMKRYSKLSSPVRLLVSLPTQDFMLELLIGSCDPATKHSVSESFHHGPTLQRSHE